MTTQPTAARKTSIYLSPLDLQRLVALAADCGYYQTRGPAAGRAGSLSQLLAALAHAYEQNPELTANRLTNLFAATTADTS